MTVAELEAELRDNIAGWDALAGRSLGDVLRDYEAAIRADERARAVVAGRPRHQE